MASEDQTGGTNAGPFFTVLTATYNSTRSLPRVYESLCGQSFQDFEWLIVDDGSTDDTPKLVRSWIEERRLLIRYYQQEHAWKHAALDQGARLAAGFMTIWLDHDDTFLPNALETYRARWMEVPVLIRNQFGGVAARVTDEYGKVVDPHIPKSPLDCHLDEGIIRYRQRAVWYAWRSDILRQYPFPRPPGYDGYIPESVILLPMGKKYLTRFVNDIVGVYWQHDGGVHTQAGVSGRSFLRHSPGLRLSHLEYMRSNPRWLRHRPIYFTRISANYSRFSFRQGIGIRRQEEEIGRRVGPRLLWAATLPLAYVLHLRDRLLRW